MDTMNKAADDINSGGDSARSGSRQPGISSGGGLASLRTNPWIVCLLPFLVFMLGGTFEPAPPVTSPPATTPAAAMPIAQTGAEPAIHDAKPATGFAITYADYPWVYTAKIVLTLAAVIFVLPGYRQLAPVLGRLRVSLLAIAVGAIGIVVWVALAWAQRWTLVKLGWNIGLGTRSAFNPLEQMPGRPAAAYGFLAIRFFGLAIVVPVIEELFLRGFAMRFVVRADWWNVPLAPLPALALAVGTAVPVFLHPGEALAAAVWFSGITWLMLRTRNIWDCVVAHGVTNLLLGV